LWRRPGPSPGGSCPWQLLPGQGREGHLERLKRIGGELLGAVKDLPEGFQYTLKGPKDRKGLEPRSYRVGARPEKPGEGKFH